MMKAHKIKRKANRVQRACYNCRKRKQGCDEERPCRRCIEKGIECVEVEPKRKRGRVRQPGQVGHSHSGSPSSDVAHSAFEGSTDYYSDSSKYEDSSDVELNPEMFDAHHEELQFGRDESSPLPPTVDSEDEDDECDEAEHSCLKDFNLAVVLPLIWNDLCAHPSASMDEMDMESHATSDPNMDYPVGSPTFSSIDVWEASLDTEMKSEDFSMQVDNHPPEEKMDCWRDLVRKIGANENLRKQFARMKETWRDIINALRTFDFPKVQSSLRELDPHDETSPPVVFWSSGGRIHHASSAFCRLVGYSTDDLRVVTESQNSKIRAHSLFHPEETVKILSRQLDAVQQPMLTSYQLKTRLLGKNKQEIPVRCSISNLRDPVGTPLLTMAHFSLDL